MAENLKTTKYNTGSFIDYPGFDNPIWQNNTTGAYAWYNEDEASYKDTYGALYNWYAVNTGNLCPTGWHVPTDIEWHTLVLRLDVKAQFSTCGLESAIAGDKLKSTGTLEDGDGLWQSPNPANNKSGFTALPGGMRNPGGQFQFMGTNGCYWSSTEDWNGVLYRAISYSSGSIQRHPIDKTYGYSVRCLKD